MSSRYCILETGTDEVIAAQAEVPTSAALSDYPGT